VKDDFYIGYEPLMPESLAGRIAVTAGALVVLALTLAALLSAAQRRAPSAIFEYGVQHTWEGRIVESPYPALVTDDGGWYWLVAPGKRGAARLSKGLDGRRVRLSASLIQRDRDRMLEVVPASVSTLPDRSVEPPGAATIGVRTIDGEIVDSKCHLGVMKPGDGPTHRDCAVRCLLGEVPPMLVPASGRSGRLVLVMADPVAFAAKVAALAGRPVRVRGLLFERGGQQFLLTATDQVAVIDSEP
jgi:hypothetical protein